MASVRPTVTVYCASEPKTSTGTVSMPAVFTAPIRHDLAHFTHFMMLNNARQPYAVKPGAGYGTAAHTWGTGRAVSRIPRVPGGGTHRSGQGAFGNMCRKGGMFAPTKTWRKWTRKTNLTQRRHVLASCIHASAVPGIVMARGHRVENVAELPIVVSDQMETFRKTKEGYSMLRSIGLLDEMFRIKDAKYIRHTKGAKRNRKFKVKKGPIVVYANDSACERAFANLPGVDCMCVDNLSVLDMAPGGHVGRVAIWTEGAFRKLHDLFGSYEQPAALKKGYHLQRSLLTNADISKIINSPAVQAAVRPKLESSTIKSVQVNQLKNWDARVRVDPAYPEKHAKAVALKVRKSPEFKAMKAKKLQRKQAEVAHYRKMKEMRSTWARQGAVPEGDVDVAN
ncbi:MAG: hypothetical protein KVP17_000984 [Porospora cf. gigantea B]|uniref:uncharacterized protein n=1 Tax=Porospora cf. gigantea B TaxID=2853592 RepID=UPI003571DB76|nr:MAG: hypothetical protein KVP17_000984 [Porospora cf. gigantea B]